jgi:hypothetical protein
MNAQSVNPEQTEQIRRNLADIRAQERNGTLFEPVPNPNQKRNRNKPSISAAKPIPNYNLKSCRICGHRVSINAKLCPGCGEKNPAPQNGIWIILNILAIFGCLPLTSILFGLGLSINIALLISFIMAIFLIVGLIKRVYWFSTVRKIT